MYRVSGPARFRTRPARHAGTARHRLSWAFAALALGACGGADLGPCDPEAAGELVYGRAGLVAVKGQALMHDSCGNAVFCHSESARGGARHGAPGDMNFDMLPTAAGWSTVMQLREEIWDAVESGMMPPGRAGYATLGDGDWTFDVARSKGAPRLPKIATSEGKAVLRNWLACDAPVVAQSEVPEWAHPPEDGGVELTDFTDIYQQILGPSCAIAGCHNQSAQGGLAMSDLCDAYAQLLEPCSGGGAPRVSPGDDDSPLVDKLESDDPECGTLRMPPPPFAKLSETKIAQIRAWLRAGAPAAACGETKP